MFTRAVVAAARAASAAAATSLITLRLPTGSRSSARSRTRDTGRTRASGGRAASSVADSMATDRSADAPSSPFGRRYASVTAVNAATSSLGESERLVAQPVRCVADLLHQLGVFGDSWSFAVTRDHGHECRGLGGVQRSRRAAPRGGNFGGERLQEVLDGVGAHGLLADWCRHGPGARYGRTDPDQHDQLRIRVISGSTRGSVATVAGMRRPKYSISTAVPGSAPAGSHA